MRLSVAPAHLEVAQLGPDRFWVRGPNPALLADGLAGAGLPTEGVRVEVDPVRV